MEWDYRGRTNFRAEESAKQTTKRRRRRPEWRQLFVSLCNSSCEFFLLRAVFVIVR